MAAKNPPSISPSPRRPLTSSPSLSAVRLSPLASGSIGSIGSFPFTSSSPFTSSPALSFTQRGSSLSPDLFEDFTYSQEMDADLRRIDLEAAAEYEQASRRGLLPDGRVRLVPPTPDRDRKTWVVFRGSNPGIYECCQFAAIQTQGFSDGFQRAFPDRDSAETAWMAFVRDGTYPDYGRSPWVVFFGRKPGVMTRVTELEASVKGYPNAVFRSCSSLSEGRIKFQLFAERVVQMFDGTDPFSNLDNLLFQPEGPNYPEEVPPTRPTTPVPVVSKDCPPALQVADPQSTTSNHAPESSKSVLNCDGPTSSFVSSLRGPSIPRRGDGWYVTYHAVLPGVYCGVEALKEAKPEPGGFQCAPDKESADMLFYSLTLDGSVVWASGDK